MRPAFDAMLTIEPPPSSRCGSAAWHTRNVPVRLTPMIFCHSSNGVSSRVREAADAGAVEHQRRPAEVVAAAVDRRPHRVRVGDVDACRRGPCRPCSAISAAVFSTASATMSRHADGARLRPRAAARSPARAPSPPPSRAPPARRIAPCVPPSLVGRRNLIAACTRIAGAQQTARRNEAGGPSSPRDPWGEGRAEAIAISQSDARSIR